MSMAQGVYYDMPQTDYLRDPSLSASGMRDLRVSPLTYWVNSPLNPDRSQERESSTAMTEGTAYHKRILEGRDAFYAAYAPELDRKDHPTALKSGDELRACCARLRLKKTGTIAELLERIKAVDASAPLWSDIEADHASLHAGKEFLSPRTIKRIEMAAQSIGSDPATRALVRGGNAEVSIFWVDDETGVPLKARLDYVTTEAVADLKTFSNAAGRPLAEAVSYAVATNRYGTQAVHYLNAMESSGLGSVETRFVFLFVENGTAPNVLVREFARNAIYFEIVEQEYRQAIGFYRECLDRWGTDRPWTSSAVVESFRDEEFPSWTYMKG